jgi:fructose-1,6-bisphosphatase I
MQAPSNLYNLNTFSRMIMQRDATFRREQRGELNWLLSGIVLACKIIGDEIRRMGLSETRMSGGQLNVQGEVQKGLDVFANKVLCDCLSSRDNVGLLASEEDEHPIVLIDNLERGEYVVVFDPLDGSSNLDLNISVGTIFSIYRRTATHCEPHCPDVLQAGSQQVAAGYVMYGSSTLLVYSMGQGVHGFTLDPAIGTFILSHPNLRMPKCGACYSINEAYSEEFSPFCQQFLKLVKSGTLERKYRLRFVGSLVAEFHRTLLQGGIFLYPSTTDHPNGRLRLVYEANPIAFLTEQAGGVATNGRDRILDMQPKHLHERVPLYFGSPQEMDLLERCILQTA